MKLIAETNRLIIREFITEDAENFRKLNDDKEVVKYTGDAPFSDIKEAENVLNKKVISLYEKQGYGRWAVHLKANGLFIGWSGLKFLEDENAVDLGYRYHKRFWNKGFATEAGQACIDYGFNELNLDRIIARVMPENTASIQVLKKLGLKEYKEAICDEHPALFYEIFK